MTTDNQKVDYSDGKDYSNLPANWHDQPSLLPEGCVWCGSYNVTITDKKDICHDCGYVYS